MRAVCVSIKPFPDHTDIAHISARFLKFGLLAWGGPVAQIGMLRRELVASPGRDGLLSLPIISGNTFRGRLRRLGGELLRDELRYEGLLTPSAAHALRGGGALGDC